jgi:cell division protein DivIC
MLFFDSNDFLNQFAMKSKLNELQEEKAYYEEKIIEVKEERTRLLSNRDQLEKFARETYLMKKKSEDVYIVVKK